MQHTATYQSPLGEILLAADSTALTGLWFLGQKYYAQSLDDAQQQIHPILEETKRWLTIYFSGRQPDFMPPLHLKGTPFQMAVWKILQMIPYGQTVTYGDIAKRLAQQSRSLHMSAQAVGGAVGRNPISIIIPCHRVVGANGSLTGYAGGIERKIQLLTLEKADIPH